MSLTEIGEVFLARCQRVIEEAEAAEQSVSQLQAAPRGQIRLASAMSFGHRELAPRLPAFLERYDQVRIDLDLTDRVIDLVHEKFDLSVRIGRPREQTSVVRKLCPLHAVVCASPAYLDRCGRPATPADLRDHECMGYRPSPETWNFADGEEVSTRGSLNIDNGDALLATALTGRGIVYLPTFLVGDDIRAGRLEQLLPRHTDVESEICAVYPASRHVSPKVRALIDWLAGELGPDPTWDRDLAVGPRRPP